MQRIAAFLAVILSFSCGGDVGAPSTSNIFFESPGPNEDAEHWSPSEEPHIFGVPLERRLGRLPLSGEAAETPWVGSYWPIFRDGINFRWSGASSESAPRKYERVFGGYGIEDQVSRFHGLDGARAELCKAQSNCKFDRRGNPTPNLVCAKRIGRVVGRCVPTWWGLCHAWAAAAILHKEPRHGVDYEGVHFNVSDLKALLTLVYNTSRSRQVSLRCNTPVGRDGLGRPTGVPADAAGRPSQLECRDSNPGTFHLLVANLLGLQHRSFIEDRSMDQDVWNQPLRSFKVRKMQEVTAWQANSILQIRSRDGSYPYNYQAARLVYVALDLSFVHEAAAEIDGFLGDTVYKYTKTDSYEYILELDASGTIIGGEWVGQSKQRHPDFLWLPLGPTKARVAGGAIEYDKVMELIELSYL